MGYGLTEMARIIVGNLHQTWLYRAIEGWCRKDALELREELGLGNFSITSSDPIDMYREVKLHLLSKTFHDNDTLKFLMDAPRWAGFSLNKDDFKSGQQIIGAAKEEAIALLWLMAIPKLIVSPTDLPEEYPVDGIKQFVRSLMASEESRSSLVSYMIDAMEDRGIPDIVFTPSPIGKGYTIDDSMRTARLQSLLAMVIMRATGCDFDLDQVFTLNESEMVEETTAYIVATQAKAMLKNQIAGGEGLRPFDWPLIGNPMICSRLFTTLNVLKNYASRITTSSMYSTESDGTRIPWNKREFISFLLREISDHYSEIYRIRHGKSENPELELFIELLTGENIEISARLEKAEDPGSVLFQELNDYRQKAKVGERPKISPERRFRVVLSSLKQSVIDETFEEVSTEEIIDQVIDAFDAIVEVVERHKLALDEESERFAQALCFETAIRILQLLGRGDALMDLPWVSRFIAEESARSDITIGDIEKLDEEHRIQRIVSAYAGGLTYLILQGSRA
jgi:hypothetical protein